MCVCTLCIHTYVKPGLLGGSCVCCVLGVGRKEQGPKGATDLDRLLFASPDEVERVPYLEHSQWKPLLRKHLYSVLEGADETADSERVGTYTYDKPLNLALEWVACDLKREAGGSTPKVLVATTDAFTTHGFQESYSHEVGGRGERTMPKVTSSTLTVVRHATGEELRFEGREALVHYLQETYSRTILPHNVGDNHFTVFDVTYRGRGGGRYLKVWDSLGVWGKVTDTKGIPQVRTTVGAFFLPSGPPTVYTKRAAGQPNQGSTHGCAAFVFFTVAHLARVTKPPAATAYGEGVLRSYTCACCLQGEFLGVPKLATPSK